MTPRRIILLVCAALFLAVGTVPAQHYLGVRGGYGGGTCGFKPDKETGYIWNMYMGGVSYKYYGRQLFVGGVEIDLNYTQKGYKYDKFKGSDTSFQQRFNCIELPVMWQPYFYMFNRHAKFFLNLGANISYNIESSTQIVSKKDGVLNDNPYEFELVRDNRWGYGLSGGAGLSVIAGRIEVSIEGRYNFGFSDFLKNATKYDGNPLRSPLHTVYGMASVYVRLGKGGILAPLSKKAAAKAASPEGQIRKAEQERKEIDRKMKRLLGD